MLFSQNGMVVEGDTNIHGLVRGSKCSSLCDPEDASGRSVVDKIALVGTRLIDRFVYQAFTRFLDQ